MILLVQGWWLVAYERKISSILLCTPMLGKRRRITITNHLDNGDTIRSKSSIVLFMQFTYSFLYGTFILGDYIYLILYAQSHSIFYIGIRFFLKKALTLTIEDM